MTGLTDYAENKLLDHALGTTAFALPIGVKVALYTVTPTDAAAGTEVAGAIGYARQTPVFSAAAAGSSSNTGKLTFGPATGPWGTVTGVAIIDGTDNQIFVGALDAAKTIDTDDFFEFDVGALVASMD